MITTVRQRQDYVEKKRKKHQTKKKKQNFASNILKGGKQKKIPTCFVYVGKYNGCTGKFVVTTTVFDRIVGLEPSTVLIEYS